MGAAIHGVPPHTHTHLAGWGRQTGTPAGCCVCGSPSFSKPWEEAPSSRWRLQCTEATQHPQQCACPEASWPLPCASRYGGPRGAHESQGEGGPAGTLPTPGVPEPRLQRKPDVRLDTSRPVLTGWSFYSYIHTSRFFSCSREKLMEKGGPAVAPWGGSVHVLVLLSGQSRLQRDSALQAGLGDTSPGLGLAGWGTQGCCRNWPRAQRGHSTGSGAAAAHSSGVSRLHAPLTPRLTLPAPSGHAPDLRADAGRTREEGKRGQDRLDRTLLAFRTKNHKLHAGSRNLARDLLRGPGKAAPCPGPGGPHSRGP